MFWIIAVLSVTYLGVGGYHASPVRETFKQAPAFVRRMLVGVVMLFWLPIWACASLDGLARKLLPEKPKKEKLR